jgi:hypothetical protein
VKLHTQMPPQKIPNQLCFMSGEIVEDDMNLLPRWAQRYDFLQKGYEIAAGMAGCGLSVHATGLGVQRGVEGERAMPVILKAVTFGTAGRKRQNGIEPVQRLNRGFFIDTEHGCMLRRIQVQPEKEVPSASIKISLARNMYPAGKQRN